MALQSDILQHLLKGPKSLADLQQLSTASLPTIRRAVQSLSDSHWIDIIGQAEANGGRPAMLYGIDETTYMIFGLQLQLPGIQLIAATLSGKILTRFDLFPGKIPEPNLANRAIVDAINETKAAFPDRKPLGISIAAPGFIDLDSGEIITIGRVPSIKNFPISRHLTEATHLPVQIANDVDCMAIAEISHTQANTHKNMVYIGFCEGVKASLFLNGELYKGSIGNVGLISPQLLNLNAQDMGETTLQKLLTSNGFIEVFDQIIHQLEPSQKIIYQEILEITHEDQKFQAIVNFPSSEDSVCHQITKNMITALSIAVANIIHIVQPDKIIIGGLLSHLPEKWFRVFESAIRNLIPALISNNLLIKQGQLANTDIAAIGAIYHFLDSKLPVILDES